MEECLIANRICYQYPGSDGFILRDINCSLERSRIIGLVGLSASGKSTFARLIKGLIEPASGNFCHKEPDKDRIRLTSKERLHSVGWAGPHPEIQIFASTVEKETAYGPEQLGLRGRELTETVRWALQSVGFIPEEVLRLDPHDLSGGDKRRLGIAGIIVMRASYYIFDEPTAGLDYAGRRSFISTVQKLRDERCGVVWITHDIELLKSTIDRLWLLEKGRLVLDKSSEQVDWKFISEQLEQGKSIVG